MSVRMYVSVLFAHDNGATAQSAPVAVFDADNFELLFSGEHGDRASFCACSDLDDDLFYGDEDLVADLDPELVSTLRTIHAAKSLSEFSWLPGLHLPEIAENRDFDIMFEVY